jgi:phosphoribosylformimino-5-aminoimidazole carboxamide ribotide isomerase
MATVDEFQRLGELIAGGITPIFSLDKKGDVIITRPGELTAATPLELVQHAYRQGVKDLIVLDLAAVGTKRGFSDDDPLQILFQEIREELNDLTLISGGGVHSPADARRLLDAGCQHVLVATAIHECRFTPDDVTGLT